MTGEAVAEIGVIGGSGFYAFLDDAREVQVDTPYGPPSDPLVVAEVAGRTVAFVPRHGADHRHPPHRIPYLANLWALRSLGVRQVVAPCAVGGLQPHLGPGTLVVPDQLVDRTSGRVQTFHDVGAVHVSFADPYCPRGRATALEQARAADWSPVDGGTLVVIEGPRFSTRAESQWFSAQGWSLVGHDRPPRGGPRPRAGALLHRRRPRHRPRRRGRGGRVGHPGRGVPGVQGQHRAAAVAAGRRRRRPPRATRTAPARGPSTASTSPCPCRDRLPRPARAAPRGPPTARAARRRAGRRRGRDGAAPAGAAGRARGGRRLAAARDLPAGTLLQESDLVRVALPEAALPDGALTEAGDDSARAGSGSPVGRRVAGAVRRGEPLTDVRLLGSGLLDGLAGRSTAPAASPRPSGWPTRPAPPSSSPATGSTSSPPRRAARRPLPLAASDALVLSVPAPDPQVEGGLLVLATTPATAARLAAAAVTSRLSVVLRPRAVAVTSSYPVWGWGGPDDEPREADLARARPVRAGDDRRPGAGPRAARAAAARAAVAAAAGPARVPAAARERRRPPTGCGTASAAPTATSCAGCAARSRPPPTSCCAPATRPTSSRCSTGPGPRACRSCRSGAAAASSAGSSRPVSTPPSRSTCRCWPASSRSTPPAAPSCSAPAPSARPPRTRSGRTA